MSPCDVEALKRCLAEHKGDHRKARGVRFVCASGRVLCLLARCGQGDCV
jgi:hypothetical protein